LGIIALVIYMGAVSSLFILPLFVWAMNHLQIKPEEATLEAKFGGEYMEYQERIHRLGRLFLLYTVLIYFDVTPKIRRCCAKLLDFRGSHWLPPMAGN